MQNLNVQEETQHHKYDSSLASRFQDSFRGEKVKVQGHEKYQPILVPFSVIQLSLSDQLHERICNWDSTFFQRYQDNERIEPRWKLFEQGCYAYITKPMFGLFLTSNQLYVGNFEKFESKNNKYLPSGGGILVNSKEIYTGPFIEGKAHGLEGRLQVGKTLYKGEWKEGKLVYGSIDDPNFQYKGEMKGNMPHGKGKVRIIKLKVLDKKKEIQKSVNILYQGGFFNGLFEDELASYECLEYIYKGGFKNGKKNGKGTLTMKETNNYKQNKLKSSSKKYRPPLKIKGYWKDQMFIDKLQQDKK